MFTVNERNTHGPNVSVLNAGEEDFGNVHRKCFEYTACKCSSGSKVTFSCVRTRMSVCVCVSSLKLQLSCLFLIHDSDDETEVYQHELSDNFMYAFYEHIV